MPIATGEALEQRIGLLEKRTLGTPPEQYVNLAKAATGVGSYLDGLKRYLDEHGLEQDVVVLERGSKWIPLRIFRQYCAEKAVPMGGGVQKAQATEAKAAAPVQDGAQDRLVSTLESQVADLRARLDAATARADAAERGLREAERGKQEEIRKYSFTLGSALGTIEALEATNKKLLGLYSDALQTFEHTSTLDRLLRARFQPLIESERGKMEALPPVVVPHLEVPQGTSQKEGAESTASAGSDSPDYEVPEQ